MRLILGIGPGRCGTGSLATLLGRQPGVTAIHTCPVRPVHPGDIPRTIAEARLLGGKHLALVGPQWLDPALETLDTDERARVVVLVRSEAEVLESMDRVDYWPAIRGHAWAVGRDVQAYVRGYYLRARSLLERYPERVRWTDYATPSWPDAAAELLVWLGIAAADLRPVVENATRGRCRCA